MTLPGYEVTQWYGVLAPAGTPPEIVERLHTEIVRAVANPRAVQQFTNIEIEPVSGEQMERTPDHGKHTQDGKRGGSQTGGKTNRGANRIEQLRHGAARQEQQRDSREHHQRTPEPGQHAEQVDVSFHSADSNV